MLTFLWPFECYSCCVTYGSAGVDGLAKISGVSVERRKSNEKIKVVWHKLMKIPRALHPGRGYNIPVFESGVDK
jgi:hypothetical protein